MINKTQISQKTIPPLLVASIRASNLQSHLRIARCLGSGGGAPCQNSALYFDTLVSAPLRQQLAENICGPSFCLYSHAQNQENLVIEFCVPVRQSIPTHDITCRTLPGGDVLSAIYCGAYATLGEAWEALFDYIEGNNIPVRWPHREIYLAGTPFDSEQLVTELQVPLAKCSS